MVVSYLYAQTEWVNYRVETTQYPDNPYRTIAFDSFGNIWIGTQDKGIFRFDGSDWTIYNTSNTALPTNRINHLVIDSNNNIWIGTSGYGLIRKAAGNNWSSTSMIFHNSYNIESDFPSNEVNWIAIQKTASGSWTDRIIVATNNGIAIFNDPTDNPYSMTVITMNVENNLATNEITSVDVQYNNSNGVAAFRWYGTAQGLYRQSISSNSWVVYNTTNSQITGNGINNVRIDHLGNIWASVYNWSTNSGGGLIRISADDNENWDIYTASNPNTLPSNYIRDIQFERIGTNSITWLTTDQGITRFDGSSWTTFTSPTLPTNNIYSVSIRNNVEKWFGTNISLLKYTNSWEEYSIFRSGIPSNNIQTIAFENNPYVKWIGTANGMTRFDGNDWVVFNMANSMLPTNDIKTLAVDNNNLLWIGTAKYVNLGGGLASFNYQLKEWVIYKKTDSNIPLESDTISKVAIDSNNNKWIGTLEQGGLYSIDTDGVWTSFKSSPTGLASNNINDIFIDSENNKWISTPDYGVSVMDAQNSFVRRINIWNSNLLSNEIRKIKQDRKGFIWAVTGNGLGKLIDEEWIIYTSANSNNTLPNTGIVDIDFDNNNIGWITTNIGLVRTNEIDWVLYTTSTPNHALPSNNLNSIFMEVVNGNTTKWITTKDRGVSLFRGGNSAFETGSHIFIFQHPFITNALKISAIVNNIVVNDVEFRINNIVTPSTEVAMNTWFVDHTVPTSQNVNIRFRFWHAAGDSTQDRRINVSLLNSNKPILLDSETTIELTTDIDKEQWLITEFYDDFYRFSNIASNLKGNLILKTNINNHIQKKIIFNEKEYYWENQNFYIEGQTIYANINEQGDYRVMKNTEYQTKPSILLMNYPNPFNPITNITFNLHYDNNKVNLDVFDIKGRKIKALFGGYLNKGNHQYYWDGKNEEEQNMASGVYFLRLVSNHEVVSKKILLIK